MIKQLTLPETAEDSSRIYRAAFLIQGRKSVAPLPGNLHRLALVPHRLKHHDTYRLKEVYV